ncbi:MAG: zinc ribbon domain-containing protein [Phycisphaerae bacterium]|nr:zinc ribbon domain-containing protein [Phycisphaerae bacterium]
MKVARRRRAQGGAGHRNRRWLVTGVLECGDRRHKFWGVQRRKGRKEGRAEVITNYYTCSGRRSHGKTICEVPSTLRAEQIEDWVLGTLGGIITTDGHEMETGIQRFIANAAISNPGTADAERIAREITQINDMVTALTMNIDPANMAMLNDRLTQLRLRKDALEEELRMAKRARSDHDPAEMRRWAKLQLTGLRAAMDGVRNDATREIIATYVDKIVVWPSRKCGEMHLNAASKPLWKDHGRPFGRSWSNKIGATGFEPATS